MPKPKQEHRKHKRKHQKGEIAFYLDPNVLEATAVNLSESGIRFDTDNALEIDLRINLGNKMEQKWAKLVWVEKNKNKTYSYGFEFVKDKKLSAWDANPN